MRRGAELREHILLTAKDVFLEFGYQRTSMDEVAARAATSKRSLYAHFATKENLFLAIVELVHDLFTQRVGSPEDYAEDDLEAIALYCARVNVLLRYGAILRTCRMAAAEAEHLPEASARYFETFFGTPRQRLAAFLADRRGLSAADAAGLSDRLLGQTLFPLFEQTLFGVAPLLDTMPAADDTGRLVDLAPIRQAVDAAMASAPARPAAPVKRRPRTR